MSNVVCPLCSSADNQKRFSDKGYELRVCNICELLFINPYPSDTDKRYDVVRDYSYDEMKLLPPDKHYDASYGFYKMFFPFIEPQCADAESILDVGCGTGCLFDLLKKYPNLHRVGIELNTGRAEFARKKTGCEVYEIPIEKFSSDNKFSVITLINVLAHIPNLQRLFVMIHSLLSKEGKLILITGEVAKNVEKGANFDWGIPDHIHFLGLNTIQYICERFGFKVIKHERNKFSQEFFSVNRWKIRGRSRFRNMVKNFVVKTRFVLPVLPFLRKLYELKYGEKVYISYMTLVPKAQ